jgi:hypothetical protein
LKLIAKFYYRLQIPGKIHVILGFPREETLPRFCRLYLSLTYASLLLSTIDIHTSISRLLQDNNGIIEAENKGPRNITSPNKLPVILKPKAIGNFTSPFGASSFDLHFCCCSCARCCCSQAPIQTLQIRTPFFSKSFLSFTALFVPFISSERKTAIFQSPQLQCLRDQRKTLDFFSCPKDFETKSMGSELDYEPNILDLTHKLNSLCLSQAVLENSST